MSKQKLHRRFIIDGTTTTGAAPKEYVRHLMDSRTTVRTFENAMDKLASDYNIDAMPMGYDPERGNTVSVSEGTLHEDIRSTKFQVTYNPAWLPEGEKELPEGRNNPIWDVVTNTYTPTGPDDMWEPLLDVLRDKEIEVFGSIRLTRDGGQMHMDLFFPEKTVEYEDFEHVLGISTGHDYFGNTRLYAEVVALDLNRDLRKDGVHVLRDLTDAKKRKHTGSADADVNGWWDVTVSATDRVSETLYNAVTDAMAYEIDIGDLPVNLEEFYEHLGLPNTGDSNVAEKAAHRALSTVAGCYDAYHLHRAAMNALEDTYAGKDTRVFVQHTATVNALLFSPPVAEKDVLKSVREEIDEAQTDFSSYEGDKSGAELETRRDHVTDRIESIPDGVDEFETARDRLSTMLEDAENEAEAEEAA